MFAEGLQEKLKAVGDGIQQWVNLDLERGARQERTLKQIMRSSEVTANVEYDYTTQVVTIDTTGTNGNVSFPQVPQGFVWFYRHIAAKAIAGTPAGEVWLDNTVFIGGFDANTLVVPIFNPIAVTEGRKLIINIEDGGASSSTRIFAQLEVIKPASKRLRETDVDEADGQSEGRPTVNQINFGRPVIPNERGTRKDATPAVPTPSRGIPISPKS